MKNNKVLIYDDKCPLCAWYTGVFIKYKLLSNTGRMAFSEVPQEVLAKLDVIRACNEIPLLDTQTNEVVYGIDAMVEVLNQKLPFVKPIAHLAPVNWFLRKLYKLISYNRKGIVARVPQNIKFNCVPSYSFNYKKFFIAMCYIVSAVLLQKMYYTHFARLCEWLYLISGLLVIGAVLTTNKVYLEAVMQATLQIAISCVLLLPVIWLMPLSQLAALLYLGVAAAFITKQIWDRCKYWWYFKGELN
jgi:predicted DCC family thiol-disulfide oxidoreductase YuxK